MSFNIPIMFEDSPFFGEGFKQRRQPRNDRQTQNVRRPDIDSFGQWPNFGSIFDEAQEDPYERQYYGHRPRREWQGRPSQNRTYIKRQQFVEPEGSEDSDEMSGVTENMRDMPGLDGWDVPVQFMGSPETGNRARCNAQNRGTREPKVSQRKQERAEEPVQFTTYHESRNRAGCQDHQHVRLPKMSPREYYRAEVPGQHPQREGHRPANHGQNIREYKGEEVLNESAGVQDQNKPIEELETEAEGTQDEDTMSAETNDNNKENEGTTEIHVEYSNKKPRVTKKRLSRRLSQCDPPPLADIKIARVKSILEKTDHTEEKIAEFEDPIQSKAFLIISETLMRALLDLDEVDSDGLADVRKARKEAIVTVQGLVDKLEKKLKENKQKQTL